MRVAFTSIFEQATRVGRVAGAVRSQPSWLIKLALFAVVAALAAVGLLVLVPALVLGLVVFVAAGAVLMVRGGVRRVASWFFTGVRRGDASGRRNVRVMTPR